eukprot:TRINITY_DN450_c0_g2_i1.p1 TRINITY_DN450_c0_g2~~TRINITY_DN450_c0_g2_i1.p1  ORF type:complete len:895 (+),score=295.10 TRINITY_DN450_c0_g2_i1:110-2794(+)
MRASSAAPGAARPVSPARLRKRGPLAIASVGGWFTGGARPASSRAAAADQAASPRRTGSPPRGQTADQAASPRRTGSPPRALPSLPLGSARTGRSRVVTLNASPHSAVPASGGPVSPASRGTLRGALLTPSAATQTDDPRRGSDAARLQPPQSMPGSRMADLLASGPPGMAVGGLGGPGSSGLFPLRMRRNVVRAETEEATQRAAAECGVPAVPFRLPDGLAAAAAACGVETLCERDVVVPPELADLSISEPDVRQLYRARCADHNTELAWHRYGRFAEMIVRKCAGMQFRLSDAGVREQCAAAVASVLRNNDKYSILDLSGNRIRDPGAAAIAQLLRSNATLVHLALRSCGIGPQGAELVAGALLTANRTLTSLDLSGGGGSRNLVGPRGAAQLAEVLRHNPVLASLSVACCGLGMRGACVLAAALADNHGLTELDLSHNGIGHRGGAAMAAALGRGTLLRQLRLRGNSLRDEGVGHIAAAAREPLEALDLADNGFSSTGLRALGGLVQNAVSLRELVLDNNPIAWEDKDIDGHMLRVRSTDGMLMLAGALREARRLRSLSVRCCDLDADAAQLLAVSITAPGLTSLSCGDNPLGAAGSRELLAAVSSHPSLRSLEITEVALQEGGDAGLRALAELLRSNTVLQRLQVQQRGVMPAPSLLTEALANNSTLLSLDSCPSEVAVRLQRNRELWQKGRQTRLAAQIESRRSVETDLHEKLVLVHGADRELDKQQQAKRQRRAEQHAMLHAVRTDLEIRENEAQAVHRQLLAAKAEEEEFQEEQRQLRQQHDEEAARIMRKVDHDHSKAKESESTQLKLVKQRAAVEEAMRADQERHDAEMAKLEDARQRVEAAAKQLGSELAAKEMRLRQLDKSAARQESEQSGKRDPKRKSTRPP